MPTTLARREDSGVVRKAARRLLPLLFALYVVNFLDRANIGVAALAMNADLGLTATAYGTASGIFFLGYVLFQVPAGAALERVGARRWLTTVVIAWGLCSAATALVTDAVTLYAARFALGLAEAGFFPGVIAYLARWFPCRQRGRAVAVFLLAIPTANIAGLPLSGLIVEHGALPGLPGWRAMFLLEALPAILLGLAAHRLLPDGPRHADWLTEPERQALDARLAADNMHPATADQAGRLARAAAFAAVYAGLYFALYALQFFLPQMVTTLLPGSGPLRAGVFAAIPYTVAAVAILVWTHHSDRHGGSHRGHIGVPAAGAAVAAALAATATVPLAALALLSLAIAGIFAAIPVFWNQCTAHLAGPRASVAIAAVNAVSSLASFAGPYLTGHLKDTTGTFQAPLTLAACILAAGAVCTLLLPRPGPAGPGV